MIHKLREGKVEVWCKSAEEEPWVIMAWNNLLGASLLVSILSASPSSVMAKGNRKPDPASAGSQISRPSDPKPTGTGERSVLARAKKKASCEKFAKKAKSPHCIWVAEVQAKGRFGCFQLREIAKIQSNLEKAREMGKEANELSNLLQKNYEFRIAKTEYSVPSDVESCRRIRSCLEILQDDTEATEALGGTSLKIQAARKRNPLLPDYFKMECLCKKNRRNGEPPEPKIAEPADDDDDDKDDDDEETKKAEGREITAAQAPKVECTYDEAFKPRETKQAK